MKVYISADIEGISGVSSWEEVMGENHETLIARDRMTKEVSSACFGASEAGANEILVKDAHGNGRNIDISGLPINTKVHRGWSMGPLRMMEGLDESFDCVMFIGYHAGASMGGNPLAHTFSNSKFQSIILNDEMVSEFDINAMIASYYKVPVVFLSGDELICEHARKKVDALMTVATSKGIGNSSIVFHPEVIGRSISENIVMTFRHHDFKCYDLPNEFHFQIEFKEAKDAYKASYYPGVKKETEKCIKYLTNDYMDFLKMFLFI